MDMATLAPARLCPLVLTMLPPHIHHLSPLQKSAAARWPPTALTGGLVAPWEYARHQIDLGLADLTEAVRIACKAQPDREEILAALQAAVDEVNGGLRAFEKGLVASATPEDLVELMDAARLRLVDDELIQMLDNNGFAELRLADTLHHALNVMGQTVAIRA